MKNLYTAGLLFVLLFTAHLLHAQVEPPLNEPIPDKPLLFVSLPDKFECDLAELEKLFSNSVSQTFSVRLHSTLLLDGVVAEKIARSNQLLSLNLRLKNYGNALFNLNRINENGNVYYSGRIVNIDHGDLLILKKEKEKYFFIKQQQRFSMVE